MADTSLDRFAGFQWLKRVFGGAGGTMFGGARDLYSAFGYNKNPIFDDYLFKYLKQDIAKRIIDAPVRATWGDPPTITADDAFQAAWQNVTARQSVWHKMMQLDKLTGIGRFAIMVIGIDDGKALDQPATPPDNGTLRELLYLQPYMERSVNIETYETDQANPRFGLPTTYKITPAKNALVATTVTTATAQLQPFMVHWSRVLHIADQTLESPVFGSPRLECVYNLLDDLLKVVGGSAETYWMTANRGLQIDIDKDMELDKDDAANLSAELDEFQHNLRRIVRTRGATINNLGSDLADPWNNVDVLLSLISSGTGIPKRVLVGSEAGQLASTQDRANWAVRIAERVTDYAEPTMLIPFIKALINLGVVPNPTQMNISWPEAFKLSPLERAQTSAQMARSAANLQKMLSDPIGGIKVEQTITVTGVVAKEDGTVDAEWTEIGTEGSRAITSNAFPVPAKKGTTKPAAGTPPPPPSNDDTGVVEAEPAGPSAVIVTKRTWIEGGQAMFDMDESRAIVGFGKTMPVFDDSKDVPKQPA
jgi:hypothetical protein